MAEYILASGSPRRKEILTQVGISFKVIVSECEETSTYTNPEDIVGELAYIKCKDISDKIISGSIPYELNKNEITYIVGADTMVSADGTPLGKPRDKKNAFEMIKMIQGKRHIVSTGVCIAKIIFKDGSFHIEKNNTFVESSYVKVAEMNDEEIKDYVYNYNECDDKAGAYAIQGLFAKYIEGIEGDYYNIVGFPICRFIKEIKEM